jgi:hypothetical protein
MLVVINCGRESSLRPEQDRPMGEIQTAALWLASALARRGYETHIFGRCKHPGHRNGVTFHDRSEFAEFTARRDIDVLVAIPEVVPLLMPLRARAGVVWTGNAYQTGDCALEIPWTWAKDIGYRESGRDSTRWRCCILTRTWLLSIRNGRHSTYATRLASPAANSRWHLFRRQSW